MELTVKAGDLLKRGQVIGRCQGRPVFEYVDLPAGRALFERAVPLDVPLESVTLAPWEVLVSPGYLVYALQP